MSSTTVLAPTRIDLAGGTLDIWPLTLLVKNPSTLNVAISLEAEVQVTPAKSWEVVAEDIDVSVAFQGLDDPVLDRLPLIREVLHSTPLKEPLHIRTHSAVPLGSGLGGSSTLVVALLKALDPARKGWGLVKEARNIEGGMLRLPPGFQDAGAAVFGGISHFCWSMKGWERVSRELSSWLSERMTLVFSGATRFSGTTNWDVFKAGFDGDKGVLGSLERIAISSYEAFEALINEDVERLAESLAQEMNARIHLNSDILSPVMEEQIEASLGAGALVGKVCGAGGGGCFLLLHPPARREAIAQTVEEKGGTVLAATPQSKGVRTI
ncbi:hypothetical protein H8D30_01420 [bacterium]|nr:hypothetical protein [bacterium]